MFGDTLLDRLHFCRLVYDLFDQILNEPNGAERLGCARPRLTTGSLRNSSRSRDTLNRAIAKGVVSEYAGSAGSQPYDPILWSSEDWSHTRWPQVLRDGDAMSRRLREVLPLPASPARRHGPCSPLQRRRASVRVHSDAGGPGDKQTSRAYRNDALRDSAI